MVYLVGELANLATFWHPKWKALVDNSPQPLGIRLNCQFTEGHPPSGLWPRRGLWLATQRAALKVTLTMTPVTNSAMSPALTSGMATTDPLILWLNLSISLVSTSAVSSDLWWATLRSSTYDSLLLSLAHILRPLGLSSGSGVHLPMQMTC